MMPETTPNRVLLCPPLKWWVANPATHLKRNIHMKPSLALIAALCLAAPAFAHGFSVGDFKIRHPHIPQPAASAKAAGGFMVIVNNGSGPDRLIGIESDIAMKSEVHESRVDANGVGTMTHIGAVEIPAGSIVTLKHGDLHIMFMGLTGTLTEGKMHKATLIFEKAGRVELEFSIDAPIGQGAGIDVMDNSKMDHGGDGAAATN